LIEGGHARVLRAKCKTTRDHLDLNLSRTEFAPARILPHPMLYQLEQPRYMVAAYH